MRVTIEQFGMFCEETGRDMPVDYWGWERGDIPVILISWYDAVEFCNWLSDREDLQKVYIIDKTKTDANNKNEYDHKKWLVTCDFNANGYRLPTEAEWEFACRGGNRSKGYQYSGSNEHNLVAWYKENTFNTGTQPVGKKYPNEIGLYDMSGNVWEWCWDWYSSEYYSSSPLINPKGPLSGSYRALRGGSWRSYVSYLRCANRIYGGQYGSDFSTGFRPVRTHLGFFVYNSNPEQGHH